MSRDQNLPVVSRAEQDLCHQFHGSGMDRHLGLFDQAVWAYSRLEWLPNTVLRLPHTMGDHLHDYWGGKDTFTLIDAEYDLAAPMLQAAGVVGSTGDPA